MWRHNVKNTVFITFVSECLSVFFCKAKHIIYAVMKQITNKLFILEAFQFIFYFLLLSS